MSLYIDKTNQTYLWNSVTKHPKFQPYIREIPIERFSEWFRSIIEGFYLNWGGNKRPINAEELKQLNRNTITYIYQNLSGQSSSNSNASSSQDPMTVIQPYENPMMPNAAPVSNIAMSAGISPGISAGKPVQVLPEFTGQHEYQKRTESYQPNPKPSNPIQGKVDSDKRESQDKMERRILEEQKQREMDIQNFSPPSQIGGKQAVNLNLLKMNGSDETVTTENIQFVIRDIPDDQKPILEIENQEKPQKLDPFIHEFRQMFTQTKESIEELKQKIIDAEIKIQNMEKQVNQTSQFFSPFLPKNTPLLTKPTHGNEPVKRKSTLRGKEIGKETGKETGKGNQV